MLTIRDATSLQEQEDIDNDDELSQDLTEEEEKQQAAEGAAPGMSTQDANIKQIKLDRKQTLNKAKNMREQELADEQNH